MKICPYCENEIEEIAIKCPYCNRSLENAPETLPKNIRNYLHQNKCDNCGRVVDKTRIILSKQYCINCLQQLSNEIIITTTPTIDGSSIKEYLGVESSEVVLGTGLFSEFTSDFQDFFGQRSTVFETKLTDAKSLAFRKIKMAAFEKGANAVVGVDIDFVEFTGNRIGVIVSGTIVKISKGNNTEAI